MMVHVAGPLQADGLQLCRRCGFVLTDYRGAMVPEGQPPLGGWADGAHVKVLDGWPRYSGVTDDEVTCGERSQAR
jgi:hypothetical protein